MSEQNGNGHRPAAVDLSYWLEPEPLDFKYGEKTYHASYDMGPVLHERIALWCTGLADMTEEAAEALSVDLTAKALRIEASEAASIHAMARKRLLGFLASGRLPSQEMAP